MKKLLGSLVVLGVILFASCAPAGNAFTAMVPEDAMMFAYVMEPESFLKGADGFVEASGLGGFTGGQSLEDMAKSMGNVDVEKVRSLFDLSMPSGVVLTGTDLESPQINVLLAVKDGAGASAWLKELTGGGSDLAIDGPYNKYLVLRPSTQAALVWPPKKAIDPAVGGSPKSHHMVFGLSYPALMSSPAFAEELGSAMGAEENLAPLMMDIIKSMGWFTMGLGLDATAVVMTGTMQINPETEYGKLMTAVEGGKADASTLVAEEIMGMASNMSVKDASAYGAYMQKFVKAFGIESAEVDGLVASAGTLAGMQKGASWMSLDMDFPTGDMDVPANLEMLAIHAYGASGVSDTAKAREAMTTFLRGLGSIVSPLINQMAAAEAARVSMMMEEYADESWDEPTGYFDEESGEWIETGDEWAEEESWDEGGDWEGDDGWEGEGEWEDTEFAEDDWSYEPAEPPVVSLDFEVLENQGSDPAYDLYRLKFGIEADEGTLSRMPSADFFAGLFETRVVWKDGKAFFGMGKNSDASLKQALAGKAAGTPLTSVEGYKEVVANLDPNAQSLLHVSVARILNKAGTMMGNPMAVEEKTPGLLMSASVKDKAVTFAMAFSTKELNGYLMQVLPMLMGIFN